jgi:hypothetical protein
MYLSLFIVHFDVFQKMLMYFEGIIKYVEGISMYVNVFQCVVCRSIRMCTFARKNPNLSAIILS